MQPEFWHTRWHENRIGFHQAEVNRYLRAHYGWLGTASPVFVPLCGKSRDMVWLRAAQRTVLGVELSPLAVEAFFAEDGQVAERRGRGEFLEYQSPGITILLGDYFHLTPDIVGPLGAVYDRAALIAMPPPMRRPYAAQMAHLLAPGTPVLLIAPYSLKDPDDGPPFAVSETEVREIFGEAFAIEILQQERETVAQIPRLAEQGLAWRDEVVYGLRRL